MSGAENVGFLVYFGIAGAIGLGQCIENQRTFYVYGPPSAVWSGLLWPVWGLLAICYALWVLARGVRRALSSEAQRISSARSADSAPATDEPNPLGSNQ